MLKLLLACIWGFFVTGAFSPALAQKLISIDAASIIICPAGGSHTIPPKFTEPECQTKTMADLDPQNKELWLKTSLNIADDYLSKPRPSAIYLFGKTSSEVFLNGIYIGNNGSPSPLASDELAGKMDVQFYVPPELIRAGNNELVLHLSSHQGLLTLGQPVHFIGFGEYREIATFFQPRTWISLALFGALLLGTAYFALLTFDGGQRKEYGAFLLLAFFALGQLLVEMSRGLVNYPYPIHDVRLIFTLLLALSFGLCLLYFLVNKFAASHRRVWLFLGTLSTILAVLLLEGFDGKTAVAILIPAVFITLLLALEYKHKPTKKLLLYLALFTVFSATIALTLSTFHNLLFYYIITGLMACLFIQQTREFLQDKAKRKVAAASLAKLQFRLEQNIQQQTPLTLKISSAGRVDLIVSNTISYCKAAGDYVEIHLQDNKQHLYSGSLKSLESQLPATFLRVHRSFMVNLDCIKSLKSSGSTQSTQGFLVLKSDRKIPVSRRIMPRVRGAIS